MISAVAVSIFGAALLVFILKPAKKFDEIVVLPQRENKSVYSRRVPTIKQVLNYRTKKKEYGQFCSYSFSYALPARYSVLHLTVFCRAVIVEK